MLAVIIFVIALSLFTYIVRALAVRYYDKINGPDINIPSTVNTQDGAIPDEIVAAITIAAFEIIKKPVIIKSIHFINRKEDTSWSRSGRLSLMSSHFVK